MRRPWPTGGRNVTKKLMINVGPTLSTHIIIIIIIIIIIMTMAHWGAATSQKFIDKCRPHTEHTLLLLLLYLV